MKTRALAAILLTTLSAVHVPVSALAADPKAPDPKAAAGTGKAPPPVSEEAKKHFKAGVDFLQDPDGARYEEAYREFKEAYRISPSWKILSNLGLAALKLERIGEAIEAYEKYLADGGKDIDAGERAQIEKDVRLSKVSGHTLVLRASAKGEVTVTDERVRTTGGPVVNAYVIPSGKDLRIVVVSGQHVLTARADGKSAKWESTLAAEKSSEHAFSFDDAKPAAAAAAPAAQTTPAPADDASASKGSTVRTVGFITAGVGGALLIGSVFTGLSAKSKESDLEQACPDKTRCPRANEDTADSAKKMASLTNVLLIGGGLLVATGVTLVVVGKPSSPASSASVQLAPVATPGGGGGMLFGRF